MSDSARKHSKEGRRLCQRCQDRKAKFRYRGEVRADRDHTLCFECFRSQREQNRARAITSPKFRLPLEGPRQLTERQVTHRHQMIAHLQAASRHG